MYIFTELEVCNRTTVTIQSKLPISLAVGAVLEFIQNEPKNVDNV